MFCHQSPRHSVPSQAEDSNYSPPPTRSRHASRALRRAGRGADHHSLPPPCPHASTDSVRLRKPLSASRVTHEGAWPGRPYAAHVSGVWPRAAWHQLMAVAGGLAPLSPRPGPGAGQTWSDGSGAVLPGSLPAQPGSSFTDAVNIPTKPPISNPAVDWASTGHTTQPCRSHVLLAQQPRARPPSAPRPPPLGLVLVVPPPALSLGSTPPPPCRRTEQAGGTRSKSGGHVYALTASSWARVRIFGRRGVGASAHRRMQVPRKTMLLYRAR